jgi:3-deoxy-D-manno-octulosonate 8-phosphate phosphatase (KDO 8-P phosphatase)
MKYSAGKLKLYTANASDFFSYTCLMDINYKQQLQTIRCLIFDVDGVLTNGSLIVMPDELYRIMNIRDGFALKEAVTSGYIVAIISGGKSESVRSRLNNLGVNDVYLGVEYKSKIVEELTVKYNLKKEEILYMGDDLPDYDVMSGAGMPCCPADACPEIKSISAYISSYKGGEGCVRDIIEQLMRLHGKWPMFEKTS